MGVMTLGLGTAPEFYADQATFRVGHYPKSRRKDLASRTF